MARKVKRKPRRRVRRLGRGVRVIRLENVKVTVIGYNTYQNWTHVTDGKIVLIPLRDDEVKVGGKNIKLRDLPRVIRNTEIAIDPELMKAIVVDEEHVCISSGNDEYGFIECAKKSMLRKLIS